MQEQQNPPKPEIEPAKSPQIDIPQPDAPQGPVITPPERTVPVKGARSSTKMQGGVL